jgi:3-oxoisoapionate-4-phosphate decarboxylase
MRNPPTAMIRLTYLIETEGSPEKLAAKIASDQSTGTFVALPGETEELKARVAARVADVRPLPPSQVSSFPSSAEGPFNRAEADIDFPFDAIGTDLAALMTITMGGVWSIRGLTGIRVTGMKLPEEFRGAHPGAPIRHLRKPQADGCGGPPHHRHHRQARAGACARPRPQRW